MCEQLAQGCYSAVWRLGFEPATALTTRLPSYTGSFHDNLAMPVPEYVIPFWVLLQQAMDVMMVTARTLKRAGRH